MNYIFCCNRIELRKLLYYINKTKIKVEKKRVAHSSEKQSKWKKRNTKNASEKC